LLSPFHLFSLLFELFLYFYPIFYFFINFFNFSLICIFFHLALSLSLHEELPFCFFEHLIILVQLIIYHLHLFGMFLLL